MVHGSKNGIGPIRRTTDCHAAMNVSFRKEPTTVTDVAADSSDAAALTEMFPELQEVI